MPSFLFPAERDRQSPFVAVQRLRDPDAALAVAMADLARERRENQRIRFQASVFVERCREIARDAGDLGMLERAAAAFAAALGEGQP